jgi:hypothetical protein
LVIHSELVSILVRSAFKAWKKAMVVLLISVGRIAGRQSAVLFTGPGRISPHCLDHVGDLPHHPSIGD